ncbi:MAG: helix-turn-helix transcriptional regulator [Verrucomicrobia bacterium]|nr:helix-turn-helix transcriptional regulator [Verrucomicrobiota bacterium]
MSRPRPITIKLGSPDDRPSSNLGISAAGSFRSRVLSSLILREREILLWLTRGQTNREIGMALHISPRTVEKHVERILPKLDTTNRTIAALLVARLDRR